MERDEQKARRQNVPWERQARCRGEVKGLEQREDRGREWMILESTINLDKVENGQNF